MVWPALIAAGAALVNGAMSNASAKSREKAADYRQFQLSKELWTHQMSNSHQLQVEDLRKAGLNPMLSASAQSNTTGNVGGHIASGGNFENVLTNAVQAYQAHQQAKVQDSQVITNMAAAENQTASAAEHAQNARYQKLKNDRLEKDPDAQDAEFGHEDTSHPDQLFGGLAKKIKERIERGGKENEERIRKDFQALKNYVTGKKEQLDKWLKEDSPIASAKQLNANIKRVYQRYQKHRKSHPLYGKNY